MGFIYVYMIYFSMKYTIILSDTTTQHPQTEPTYLSH